MEWMDGGYESFCKTMAKKINKANIDLQAFGWRCCYAFIIIRRIRSTLLTRWQVSICVHQDLRILNFSVLLLELFFLSLNMLFFLFPILLLIIRVILFLLADWIFIFIFFVFSFLSLSLSLSLGTSITCVYV